MATPTTYEALAVRYQKINDSMKKLEAEKKMISAEVKDAMGEETELLCGPLKFIKYSTSRTAYPVALTDELLGPEALRFHKIDKGGVDSFLKMAIAEEPTSQWPIVAATLEAGAVTESTSDVLKVVRS